MKASIEKVISTYRQVKSVRKTAQLCGYSKSGIEYLLKSNNIQLFPRNRSGAENASRKAIENLDPTHAKRLVRNYDFMYLLYVQKELSLPQIAKVLSVSDTTVLTGLIQCNIKRRTKQESLKGKARPSTQGSKNHNWKGGLSGWRKLARGQLNEHFTRPIMERDNFTCQWCCSKKTIVVHHHNRSFMEIVNLIRKSCNESDIDLFVNSIVKEHRLEDGITLCKVCHDSYHKKHGNRK